MRPARTASRAIRTYATAAYQAPLKAGVLPAYDQALAYIEQDRKSKLARLEQLKKQKDVDTTVLEKLEVESWANDPETRWRAATGNGESSAWAFSLHLVGTWDQGEGLRGSESSTSDPARAMDLSRMGWDELQLRRGMALAKLDRPGALGCQEGGQPPGFLSAAGQTDATPRLRARRLRRTRADCSLPQATCRSPSFVI